MFIPNNLTVPKLQTAEDLQRDALLHYDAEMELMNLILLSILNDIYNSVDACTSAKDMWKRVERLMRGTIQNKVHRETRFINEFDHFVAEPGEALVFVYNCFAQLMNDLERNDMHFPNVTNNKKFLSSLQLEWLKYVTQVCHAKRLTVDTFDDLFDYLQQFEKLFNVSRLKKLEKYHDPLALVAHTGLSSRNTSSYYVTHPTSMVDYDDEYQQDDVHTNFEDPLASAMLLSAMLYFTRAITQNISTPTIIPLRTSAKPETKQSFIETWKGAEAGGGGEGGGGGFNADNYVEKTLARNCPKPRVRDSKYFMEQMSGHVNKNEQGLFEPRLQETLQLFNATAAVEKDIILGIDEAGVILTDEQNDFLFTDASRMEEIKELSANICLMARSQPADNTSDVGPSYDSTFISEIQSSSNTENEEQIYPTHTKIINSTIDDQIDSDIIFDSPNGNVNSGCIENDTHVPDLCALEQLARNTYQEAEKQQIFPQKADKRAKHFSQQAQSQFVRDRDIIRDLEKQRDKLDLDVKDYKRQNEELQKTHSILKRQMSENEDKYHDTVLDLEAKLKKNVDLILKLGNSLQGMFMLGPKPLSVYDQQLKHGLGYPNPYTLKQAISQCPKLYLASSLGNSEISLNIRDTKDTLDDASKNFVPQKELSAEQKYFPSSFIPSDKNSNATPSIPASMPSETPLIIELDKIKNCFQKLSELIQKNCKRASIFYTSPEEIQLNDFCQDQLKPIVNELQFYFEFFKTLFQRDVKEMKDVFESTESELCELEKQNDFLKDQLLEVSLKHEVELSVLLNHECVDNSLHAEIEQLKNKSIEIQEGLQARIIFFEKDVQRCEKQSVDFELKLQHEKEKHKWDSNLKNKNTNPLDYSWISKMEKLEDENVSLDFTVQSLIKERDNVKLEYQKLFNSIKKTRSQTQTEMDELIAHVSEKTYAYGAIRAENQNLLFTISELKTRLANVEKGKSVNTKFDKTNGSQPLLCVTPLHKHVIQKKTDVQKSKENHVVSKPVTLQTSPAKQRGVNSNKNVIAPGMYKVVTTHESQTNEAKHDLSSTGMNATSSVVQIVLWIVDSGCLKHMTGDRSLLKNFIEKFMGTVRFGNDNFAAITGYSDYIQGNTCYVRNLEGDDLLTGGRESNLYTISISDIAASSPICLMSKATSTKSEEKAKKASHALKLVSKCTKKIMETINVKFDELTAMASEHDCLELELQRFINRNSSAEEMNTPSKEDLDNLFESTVEEYIEKTFLNTPSIPAAQPTSDS
ncbi:hypothetical protein Tco_1216822 [Tanacetum coccineum]